VLQSCTPITTWETKEGSAAMGIAQRSRCGARIEGRPPGMRFPKPTTQLLEMSIRKFPADR